MKRWFSVALLSWSILFAIPSGAAQDFFFPGTANFNAYYAFCIDPLSGGVWPYCNVTIDHSIYSFTGGHMHFGAQSPPPTTNVAPSSGNTDCCGLPIFIGTSVVGRREWLEVCGPGGCYRTDFISGYPDISVVPPSSNYVFIGSLAPHPDNHYATPNATSGMAGVAAQYHLEFPQFPVIALNDSALLWGGLFDIAATWKPPHHRHGRGTAFDVRGNGNANSIPRLVPVQLRFQELCTLHGATLVLHEMPGNVNEHFHCEWPWPPL